MQDLSPLAKDSMWVTSQAAGNMTSSTEKAMTAPGSRPVDPLPDRASQGDPSVDLGDALPVGTPPRKTDDSYRPGPVSWKKVD
jgi:hypothetical protein